MSRPRAQLVSFLILTFAPVARPQSAPLSDPASTEVQSASRRFLDAWVGNDRNTVLGLLDPGSITVYGSDHAEVARGRAAVKKLLADDARLWGGGASIGPMTNLSVTTSPGLAAIIFDAPFTVGGRPALPVRFALIWRRRAGRWLLTQSANVVPTQGQSASDLLGPPIARQK